MKIYIDILFIYNFVINYLIIYLINKFLNIGIKNKKMLLSSSTLSLISILIIYIEYKFKIEILFSIKIIILMTVINITFNNKNIRELLKQIFLFFIINFMLAGCLLFLISNKNNANKNVSFEKINIKNICISLLLIMILINIFKKLIKENMNNIYKIIIYIDNKVIETKALLDTGNILKDPYNNNPVIILEKECAYNLIEKNDINKILGGDFADFKYLERLNIVPFKSIGKENGILVGIRSDKVEIINNDIKINKENIIIAMYDAKLTNDDKYCALIGNDIIKESI